MPFTTGIATLDEAIVAASLHMWDRIRRFSSNYQSDACASDERTYQQYFLNVATRTSRVKTVLYCNEPISIEEFFVPLDLRLGKDNAFTANFGVIKEISKKSVIVGTGGCGKSTILRVMFQECLYKSTDLSPFFVDLRRFEPRHADFSSFVIESMAILDPKLKNIIKPDSFLRYAKSGSVALFLDGYDEIAPAHRKQFLNILQEFSLQAPLSVIIITSRDTGDIRGVESFSVFDICKLTHQKAIEIVRKTSDAIVSSSNKTAFLESLTAEAFQNASGFADNPLLLSLMLLTFSQRPDAKPWHADYPTHVFDVMFARHDAFKGGFERVLHSGLERSSMLRIFEAFCALGYLQGKYEWSETNVSEIVGNASKLCEVKVKPDMFMLDLVESICVLIRDGHLYRLVHRYIQEYFCAAFLIKSDWEFLANHASQICIGAGSDTVLEAMFRASPARVKKEVFGKHLDNLIASFGIVDKIDEFKLYEIVMRFIVTVSSSESRSSTMYEMNPFHIESIYEMLGGDGSLGPNWRRDWRLCKDDLHEILSRHAAPQDEQGDFVVNRTWMSNNRSATVEIAKSCDSIRAFVALVEWRLASRGLARPGN